MENEKENLLIGAHTSAAGGAFNALLEGREIGASTIQLFTANQKRWESRPLDSQAVEKWQDTLKETGLKEIMSHDSYLINLGAPKEEVLVKSRKAFREEVERCLALGVSYLNFHPGAALDSPVEKCLDTICESIAGVQDLVQDSSLTLLIETTAGQGSTVGCTFEQIAYMVENTKNKVPIGVCVDTCHIFVAGYDIRDAASFSKTLEEFDKIVGLHYLKAFHLNDSLKGLGSRVDRHLPLGEGEIGIACFQLLMTDPRTRHLPKYLETPGGPSLWVKEIARLREFAAN